MRGPFQKDQTQDLPAVRARRQADAVSRATLLVLVMMAVAASPGLFVAGASARSDLNRDRVPPTTSVASASVRAGIEPDTDTDGQHERFGRAATRLCVDGASKPGSDNDSALAMLPAEPVEAVPMCVLLGGRVLDLPPPAM